MKNECEIVRDLLFGYNDNILSNASKELVEEHLKKCEDCKAFLEEIKNENMKKNQVKEINYLKKVNKKINKKNIFIAISMIFLAFVILFNLLVYINYQNVASIVLVYLEDVATEEEIKNIRVAILECDENIEVEFISKEESLKGMKDNLKTNQNVLEGYNTENNPFPAYIKIKVKDTNQIEKIIQKINDLPGIAHINSNINNNPYVIYIRKMIDIIFQVC